MSEVFPDAYDEVRTQGAQVLQVYKPQTDVALTVSGGATPSDTSGKIFTADAEALILYGKNGGPSTSVDVEVYASWDGADWDTEVYAVMNLGNGKSKSLPLTPGVRYLRVKAVNKDAANTATVNTRIVKRRVR